jgi:hypothetical protein
MIALPESERKGSNPNKGKETGFTFLSTFTVDPFHLYLIFEAGSQVSMPAAP